MVEGDLGNALVVIYFAVKIGIFNVLELIAVLRDLWGNIKHTNIRVIGVPEEELKKKGTFKIF